MPGRVRKRENTGVLLFASHSLPPPLRAHHTSFVTHYWSRGYTHSQLNCSTAFMLRRGSARTGPDRPSRHRPFILSLSKDEPAILHGPYEKRIDISHS